MAKDSLLADSEHLLQESVQAALYLLYEIDAVGGAQFLYIPPQLDEIIAFINRAVPTGSLGHLAEPGSYFVEDEYPLPEGVLIGRNQVDNFVAYYNRDLKWHYEEMAFLYNRMNFLVCCGDQLRSSKYYAGLYEKLKKSYDMTLNCISHVLFYRQRDDRPYYGDTFNFPADLRQAVEAILLQLPTSSKWIEEQERRKIEKENAEKKKEELKRRQREADMRQREAETRQREAEARQREADMRQREAETRQREAERRRCEESNKPLEEIKKKIAERCAKYLQKSGKALQKDVSEDELAAAPKKKAKHQKMPLGSSNPFSPLYQSESSSSEDDPSENKAFAFDYTKYSMEEIFSRASKKYLPKARTLHMRNVPWRAEFDDVKGFFEGAGKVVDVYFPTHSDGSRKGFCFVEFESADAAAKALQAKQSKELQGRKIVLNQAKQGIPPHGNRGSSQNQAQGVSNSIFIRGYDKKLAEHQIRSALGQRFCACGEITKISIPTDSTTGTYKGIAFIHFKDLKSVSEALELNGTNMGGYMLTVEKPRGNAQPDSATSGVGFGGRFADRSGNRDGLGRGAQYRY